MKEIFSVPAVNSNSESIYFSWQKHHGNYLAINDDSCIRVYDKKGKELENFNMPGICTGFGWVSGGSILASVCTRNGMLWLWDGGSREISQVETGFRDKDTLTFMMWSRAADTLAIGTLKGNLFLYHQHTSKKVPILGKHTKRIHCGAWNQQNLLALGSDDKTISVNNSNGDTITSLHNVNGEISDVKFNSIKSDSNENKGEENTVSFIKDKKILSLYSFLCASSSMEIKFKLEYGSIVSYAWYGDGYICVGFSMGYYVIVSSHEKEIGREIFQVHEFKDHLSNFSISSTLNLVALVGDSGVKIHNIMHPDQQCTTIPNHHLLLHHRNNTANSDNDYNGNQGDGNYNKNQNGGLKFERVRWSEDGQLLAVSSSAVSSAFAGELPNSAASTPTPISNISTFCHVFLAQLPVVGGSHGTIVAYLTSLNEVTMQDPVFQVRPKTYTIDIEPSFLAINGSNLVIGLNNIAIFYAITDDGLMKEGQHEYLGSVESIQINGRFYVSALFDGKVTLHKVNSKEGDDTKDMITFPNKEQRNKEEKFTTHQLTDDFLIFATNKGNLYYFHLEEWNTVTIHHHSSAINYLRADELGTRVVMVDDRGCVFLYDPIGDRKWEVRDVDMKVSGVVWDAWQGDKDIFVVFDKECVKTFHHIKNHLKGQKVEYIGVTKLLLGQVPLLLHGGSLSVMLNTGGIKSFYLDSHPYFSTNEEMGVKEMKENLSKLLKLGRLGEANYVCKNLNDVNEWERLGMVAMETMDVEAGIKAFRWKGDVSMVMGLQDLMLIEDRNLLIGHLNVLIGDFETAQHSFLQSSLPTAALEMRRDLMHWEQVLDLAHKYKPQEIPYISKEFAQQLEFTAQYPASLQHYKQAIIPDKEVKDGSMEEVVREERGKGGIVSNSGRREGGVRKRSGKEGGGRDVGGRDVDTSQHNQSCIAGVARMTIRTGDIRKGMDLTLKTLSKAECKDCAVILESMKQYSEAGLLYAKAEYFDMAANAYIKAKNWTKVGELLSKTTVSKTHTQFAKSQEEERCFKEAAVAYESGKDWENAVRLHLDHFKNPTEAARIVKESNSIEGAKMVARHFESSGDFQPAIQFLVFSKCNNEAFRLAQKHGHMQQYADIIGDDATQEDLKSMAVHFESEGDLHLAGKFCFMAGNYHKAISLLLNPANKENHEAISLAVQVAGRANDHQINDHVISYLMGETDDYPKDPKYLFQLHLMQSKYKEAASIATIIAREQQNEGSYRLAHKLLFEMCVELAHHKLQIPSEMLNNLAILHSYVLVKMHIKLGEHTKAARLLIRVSKSISKFPQHTVQILTSTVIECQRSGLKNSAFTHAGMLMKMDLRDHIDGKYKKKIEAIVRKPDRSELEEASSACPYCSYDLTDSVLLCPSCKNNIPFCIASGNHIIRDQSTVCPHCKFPAIISEISTLLSGGTHSCPMCGEGVDVLAMQTSCPLNELLNCYK